MKILALETSTSSAKAMIYSVEDGILGTVMKEYPEDICNVVTQDAEGMFSTLLDCANEVLDKCKCSIDIIGLCSTWHSLLLLDEDRNPLTRIMTWAYTNCAKTVNEYRNDKDLKSMVYQHTGCPMHSIYPLWKYIDFAKDGRFRDSKIYISSQLEYVFEKLTGEIATSKCVASGTGLMNIHKLKWDDEILEFAGLKKEQLSPLHEFDYQGKLSDNGAKYLGLKSGTPVVIGGADGALNQVGSGAIKSSIMTLSIGTSGALRITSDVPVLPDNPSTWCYYAGFEKRLAGAATNGAGNCLQWFARKVNRNIMSYAELDAQINKVKIKSAPIYLPFNYGERSPGWHDNRLGSFCALNPEHDLYDMYYSILEGVIFNLYHCYEILCDITGKPDEIRISGGILNSDIWLQMAADIFQCDLMVSKIEHASTIGAIGVVLKSSNMIGTLEEFDHGKGRIISPNPDKIKLYQERFDKYIKYYNK